MTVTTSYKRQGLYRLVEPFYIGTNEDPLFDEHVTWEGKHNKLTQAFVMCMQQYDYHVLSDAFVVHKPGIKSAADAIRAQYTWPMFVYIRDVIAKQYKIIFGFEDYCYLHNNE